MFTLYMQKSSVQIFQFLYTEGGGGGRGYQCHCQIGNNSATEPASNVGDTHEQICDLGHF